MDNPIISANAPVTGANDPDGGDLDRATDPTALGPFTSPELAALNNPVRDQASGTGGAGADLSASEVHARAVQRFTSGKSDITGLAIADLTGLVPQAEPEPGAAEKELISLVSDAVNLQNDRVRVDMTGKTLEAFMAALEKLPKNEIRLRSIVAVGYERSTKNLIFYQA